MGILDERENAFLLGFEGLSFLMVVSLAYFGEERIAVYLSGLTIAYFSAMLVFRVKTGRYLNFVGFVLLVVFAWSVVTTVM